ncbi:hypothetical protein [Yersinia intermedia]|uniref:hypothetical protein n=1 Tax=Yersinia intermedia TaxID=631 RepID=UPI0005DFBAD5|nr:hypothetical protein [Yersinia intermedia]MCB5297355.1 hypothetical protein [Yersinia intermedia]CNE42803.1 Uncharacterised protein [Yersinia intermedia]
MIFSFSATETLLDFSSEKIQESINNLLTSYREGKHIIIAPIPFLDKIRDANTIFSEIVRNSAGHASEQQYDYRSLLNDINFFIEVDFSSPSKCDPQKVNQNTEKLVLGYQNFTDSSKTQLTTLMGENLNDVDFYKFMAEKYKYVKKLSAYKSVYNAVGGGGGSTKAVFDNIVDKGGLCLCILDNDIKHPDGKHGSTSQKFLDDKNMKLNGKYIIIKQNEAECLIPLHLIDLVAQENGINYVFINNLDNLRKLIQFDPNIRTFFDHKEGIDVKKALKIDGQKRPYWAHIIKNAPGIKKNKCVSRLECHCETPCLFVGGFSEKLLVQTIKIIEKHKKPLLIKNYEQEIEDEWINIGKHIFSWSCAPIDKARLS